MKQLRILVNPNHIIRIRPLEETWNLLDPLSVGKRVVLFNFRVSLSLSIRNMKFSGPKTLSFTFLRSLLSTVPHSSSRNDPGYTHTHIYNVEFVSDTTRIFHYSDGDTIVLASNLAFETSNNLEPVFQMCITFRIPKQVKTFGNKLSNLLIPRQLLYATFDHRELKNFTNSILYVYVI